MLRQGGTKGKIDSDTSKVGSGVQLTDWSRVNAAWGLAFRVLPTPRRWVHATLSSACSDCLAGVEQHPERTRVSYVVCRRGILIGSLDGLRLDHLWNTSHLSGVTKRRGARRWSTGRWLHRGLGRGFTRRERAFLGRYCGRRREHLLTLLCGPTVDSLITFTLET